MNTWDVLKRNAAIPSCETGGSTTVCQKNQSECCSRISTLHDLSVPSALDELHYVVHNVTSAENMKHLPFRK